MKLFTFLAFAILLLPSCEVSENKTETKTPPEYVATEEFSKLNMPFSQAVIVGDIIYVSGQVGEVGFKLVEGGITPETQQTMTNIKNILEQNGSSMNQVIKCTCMLADISEWGEMNIVYSKFFPNNKPARSALAASGLALNARVEIECMAYIDK